MTVTPIQIVNSIGNLAPGDTLTVHVDGKDVTGPISITEYVPYDEIGVFKIEQELGYEEGVAVVFGKKSTSNIPLDRTQSSS